MLLNGGQRIKICMAQTNRFDYEEFSAACTTAGIQVMPQAEWVSKIGTLSAALSKYPDLSQEEAYTRYVYDMNNNSATRAHEERLKRGDVAFAPTARQIQTAENKQPTPSSTVSSCCGGGMAL